MNTAVGGVAYELTVAGTIGPALRAALATHRVTTRAPCTVLRIEDAEDGTLAGLLARLEAADVSVQEVRRLG